MKNNIFSPPKQAPNVKAQINGGRGKLSPLFFDIFAAILTIIVANGTLSTNALTNAETHIINSIATASLKFSFTDRIIHSVCFPIHAIRPIRESA